MVNQNKYDEWLITLLCGFEEMNKPYIDTRISDTEWIREFNLSNSNSDEYVWHRDKNYRIIEILEGEGWQFQFDNELPFFINSNDIIHIPKMFYHRIIPGKTKLRIKINEKL